MKNRVFVTGLGAVTSIGIGKSSFWDGVCNGLSGINRIRSFDTAGMPTNYGGEIQKFDPSQYISLDRITKIGRASQLACSAAKMAIVDSGIDFNTLDLDRVGVSIGTTMGESQAIESIDAAWIRSGEDSVPKHWIQQYPGNSIATSVAQELGALGVTTTIPTACAAGNYAIGHGFDVIQTGSHDLMVVGGADAFSKIAYLGFNRLYAMSPNICRPFDRNREGMLLGEGAGFLILESEVSAFRRKAHIYSEVIGYSLSCDASHMTIPNKDGVVRVMSKALDSSKVNKEKVGYISAHGTGTKMNDKVECSALHEVFDTLIADIPVSSIKSMLGHTMGAASALEAIACCLAIDTSIVPPTINFDEKDPECDIDCVPNKSRNKQIQIALNNSFAFGGNNACLVLGKFKKYD